MKKILVFSHAAVLEVNRDLFYALSRLHEADLRIACPDSWRGDLIRELRAERNETCPEVAICQQPVRFSGNGSLFRYRFDGGMAALRAWAPDLVFVDEEPWSLACRQIYRAFPRAELVFYTKQNLRKRVPFPFNLLQRQNFARSRSAFAVSEEVAGALRWKGFRSPIHVLPHSYDPSRFRPLDGLARQELRASLGFRPEQCVVGYFGRLDPEKGITDLCTALEKISPDANVGALFVGNGKLADAVRLSAERAKGVPFVHRAAIPHHQVGRTLGAIDVLVLPSRTTRRWKEQFGRILVEGMACGAAVIGSDSGEIPHLIQRSGGGVVVPEGDISRLAEAITELAAHPDRRDSYRERGQAYVERELAHAPVALRLGAILGLAPI